MKNLWQKSASVMTIVASLTTVFAISAIAYGQFIPQKQNIIPLAPAAKDIKPIEQVAEQDPVLDAVRATPSFGSLVVNDNLYVGNTVFTNTVQAKIGEDESGILTLDANEVSVDDLTVTGNLNFNVNAVNSNFNQRVFEWGTRIVRSCPVNKKVLSCGYSLGNDVDDLEGIKNGGIYANTQNNSCTLVLYADVPKNVVGTITPVCY